MSLAKYDKYKDSGVDWLGEIPEHWEVKRVKDLIFKIGSGVTPKGGSEVYVDEGIPFIRSQNVYDDGLWIDNVSFITEETNNKMSNSQLRPNDILINITGASIGRSCIVPETLKIANINQHIIYLRSKKRVVPYLSNYIKSSSIKGYIMLIQAGSSKEALNMGQTLNIPVLVPSYSEQTVIATYLDSKTSAIDRKVSLLEQKITHYQQLRKSLINETVCRGLNRTVKLKDSGIEWIGEIPEHWGVKRGKDLFKEISKKGYPNEPLLAASQKLGVVLKTMLEQRSMEAQKDFENFKLVQVGDFVISLRSFEGGIETAYYKGIISPVYSVFSFLKKMDIDYFKHLFKSGFFILYLQSIITGIRDGQSIKFVEIQNTFFAIPPIDEQIAIASYLDEKTQKIDSIVSNIKTQIETLKELRKTLINDVVTGKIKVNS